MATLHEYRSYSLFWKSVSIAVISIIFLSLTAQAEDSNAISGANPKTEKEEKIERTLKTIFEVRANLQEDIKNLSSQLSEKLSAAQKKEITTKLDRLSNELVNNRNNFEQISTGLNGALDSDKPVKKFSLSDDIGGLLQPLIKEMKHMTSDIRQKSQLREEIIFYSEKLEKAALAAENLTSLIATTENTKLKKELNNVRKKWLRRTQQAQSNLRAAEFQLQSLENASNGQSFVKNSQEYLKEFIRKRGLYLLLGLLSVLGVLLLSRLFNKHVIRRFPGYVSSNRSFRMRLLDLVYRVVTVISTIIAPMLVFYLVEDWLLFSLAVLALFGLAWTLKYTIPKMWQQVLLILNVGSVREGERIVMNGLPWRVKRLNFYSELENPIGDMKIRIPIEKLVGQISRPAMKGEPWFPCKKSDWVILSDGVRGKVVGLSQEMVELVERGGARVSYQMSDFLSLSPRNISQSFRLKETLGISYNLQVDSTTSILEKLEKYIMEQIIKEGYQDDLMNLRVEFSVASASSLDLVIIADFKGNQAPVYNRIRRAIQRWCVDACSLHGWEIPFTQIVMHRADSGNH